MKRFFVLCFMATLMFALVGCAKDTTEEVSATGEQPSTAGAASTPAPATATGTRPAATAPAVAARPADVPARPAAPRTFAVPQGTEVSVVLTDAISTARNKAGDEFRATVADPIVVNGETVVERGATVQGRVVDAEGSGRVKGTANIRLALTSIEAGGRSYPIVTRPYVAEANATKKRDAGVIAGGGGIGAAIGAIAGGKKGAATGAIIGGAAGTGTVLATKGKEVEFEPETKLNFTLDKTAELPRIR